MTDAIKWMTETAKFMAKDRPDLYDDETEAFADLSKIYDAMADTEGPTWTSWAGFNLVKHEEDGIVEWDFTKKISTCAIFVDEGVCDVYGWTSKSGTIKHGVELPSPSDINWED